MKRAASYGEYSPILELGPVLSSVSYMTLANPAWWPAAVVRIQAGTRLLTLEDSLTAHSRR